jgi:hypothetical protein
VGAKIEHGAELAADIIDALDQPIGHLAMQKIDAPVPCRPVAMQPPSTAVEKRGRVSRCHCSSYRRARPSRVA